MKHTFIVTDMVLNTKVNFSGYGETEDEARNDCLKRYVDFQLAEPDNYAVAVGPCISKGEGPGIIECEGCSA